MNYDKRIKDKDAFKILKVDKDKWLLGCYSQAKKN